MSTNIFQQFAKMVATSFQGLTQTPNVFVADIDGDVLYAKYLASFPEGTNPIFQKNTEHDCSCCKQFIRRAGAVVTIDNGRIHSVWGKAAYEGPSFYNEVALAMHETVAAAGVRDLFRVGKNEGAFGAEQTHSRDEATFRAITWNHLYTGSIAAHLRSALPDTERGNYRTSVQVFERGLYELSPMAVETVRSLANDNNLYRGEEHLPAILQFQRMQRAFFATNLGHERTRFMWANAGSPSARFRNTVIGTLVQDLSAGMELEAAVASFEAKVAPQNYKRTTALITSGMLKGALKTIAELDLEPALERRFAVISDVSVNDVKWVDGTVRPLMKYGLANLMQQHLAASPVDTKKDEERAEDIGLDDFVARVLPETQSLEVLFKSEQLGNLMSLTAPVHPEPKQLFRYSNDFAWSYSGNVADSIKERVKRAGGRVEGAALRVSLSWFNFDDLDLHIYAPRGGGHIYYGSPEGIPGGRLDVDMNAGVGRTRQAVENIVWPKIPRDDSYRVVVNNYCQRETTNPGFVVEVESGGKISHYSYNKILHTREDVTVVTLPVIYGAVAPPTVGPGIVAANIAQEKWGLTTERYVKVNAVMLSPNYWGDNHVGNKHTFFVLEGCKSDEDTRGFYNEFLHPRLEPHRKVFEIIADQTKCRPTEGQLSGLGFSSTKKESFLVRARQGKRQRVFNVQVGEKS